ncbi:MAG: twin-arginine translocation signal domain-containing protein [Acidimicrobiales bacterium]|jgi:hypothetical protein|nr:twin-arginine translocation signal domain-containing protein [Acidimicrobiales bacterium]
MSEIEGVANHMDAVDRRRFLVKAGATAAVAGGLWAAPEILTPSRAFAGTSCVLRASTLNNALTPPQWRTLSWPASGSYPAVALTVPPASNIAIGSPSPNTGNASIRVPVLTGVGVPSVPVFYFDLNDADGTAGGGEGWTTTFVFSVPVFNVEFRVWDIDRNTTSDGNGQNYRDSVSVTATGGATVSGTAPGGGVSGTPAGPFLGDIVGNELETRSYVDFFLSGAVTSFTLVYRNAIPAGQDGTRMIIGIGDIGFCR